MKRQRNEDAIQRAVFQHIRVRGAAGMFAFHVPNGGYRRAKEAAIMKGLGVIAGVPDVIAIHRGRVYGLEIKVEGGRPTEKQMATAAAMQEAGAFTGITLDRALAMLESWGLLRGGIRQQVSPKLADIVNRWPADSAGGQ